MVQGNISPEFRLKNIGGTNYSTEEIDQNELMSKKHKTVCTALCYIKFILTSAVTGCISISVFASLVGIPTVITSSTVG